MARIEKRGDSYRLIVYGGYDASGKKLTKKKTIKFPPDMTAKQIEKELIIELDKFEKEVEKGTYLDGNITLSEFIDKWLTDYAEPNLRPKTLARYKQLLQRIRISLGHRKLETIQPHHLLEFYRNLAEGGIRLDYSYKLKPTIVSNIPNFRDLVAREDINERTIKQVIQGRNTNKEVANKICAALKKPVDVVFTIVDKDKSLSPRTVSHHHKVLSAILTTAVQWQLIQSNPAERVKPPKVAKKEAQYYNVDELNQMLDLLEKEHIKYQAMVYTVIFCGLRLAELSNLEWTDIDFDKNTLNVSKQLQYLPEYGVYELDSAKTASGNRSMVIPTVLAELLKRYKAWQEEERTKWGDKWVESNKLFTQENGDRIFPSTPSRWFTKFIKRNNLPQLTFHQLRHTNASLLISMGVDVATVSKRLGHADKSTTLRIYTHSLKEYDQEAADKLDLRFGKKEQNSD